MIVRRDHVAGGVLVLFGALVLALSGDLPVGTLASPGAGMLPKLYTVVMMGLGAVLAARAGSSPPFWSISFADVPHAARVVAVAAAAIALYERIGFLATMGLMLLTLTLVVERRPAITAVSFSAGVTALVYGLFVKLLKSPLPGGTWFQP